MATTKKKTKKRDHLFKHEVESLWFELNTLMDLFDEGYLFSDGTTKPKAGLKAINQYFEKKCEEKVFIDEAGLEKWLNGIAKQAKKLGKEYSI